jgi:antitoxin ParD1/3/4
MNIVFPPVDAQFIKSKVEDGYYSNATELVRDAVRRLREQDNRRYDELMAAIAEGEADLAAGRYEEYTPKLLKTITNEVLAEHRKGKK